MRLGVVILPEHRWHDARDLWRRAEELGFDHAWTYDHLAWRTLADGPWFAAVPTLTAAALTTTRMRLGLLVASPNFRHPVALAREVLSLDDVSGGRFTLGLGAGGLGWDATVLGQPPLGAGDRAARFAEFVELSDRLLREGRTSYEGRFFTAVEARGHPGCVQQPRVPFAVAATGRRGMQLAATYAQTWVTTGDPAAREILDARTGAPLVAAQIARLEDVCAERGRDPASLARLVLTGPSLDPGMASAGAFEETVGRYAEAGVTDLVVHWPRPEQPYAADLSVFESIFTR